MNTKSIIFSVVALLVIMSVSFAVGMYWDCNNRAMKYQNLAEAQRGRVEAIHDNMWKIISQKAQVSEKYRESFDSIYTHIIEGRYSQGDGSLMKWITEQNPQFDSSLYQDIMDAIEVERKAFFNEQSKMLDIIRQHKDWCRVYPNKWFIKDEYAAEIEYTVISSEKTKDVMKTGVDNEVNVF